MNSYATRRSQFARLFLSLFVLGGLLAEASRGQTTPAPFSPARPQVARPTAPNAPFAPVARPDSAPAASGEELLDGRDGRELLLRNFRPEPRLKSESHPLGAAKFPVVDIHTHPDVRLHGEPQAIADYVHLMDRNQIAVCCSLDALLGDTWQEHAQLLWGAHRERFVVFVHIDWRGAGAEDDPSTWDCHRPDFARRVVSQLQQAKAGGASGLKVFKQLGLGYRNPDGSLIRVDDSRWDPIWRTCGELGMPVIMHTADPSAFFLPIDATNERWEELSRHPDWSFHGPGFPSREELLAARNRVVRRHRGTTFIAAHLANDGEDLAEVARWLKEFPNLYVELASRIAELGRQPYTARRFLIEHADRVMFGTDGPWPEDRVRLYWRFLETFDENFPYSEKPFPPQGFWRIHGVGLPDDVLRKLYHENAARLIPGVSERLDAWRRRGAAPRRPGDPPSVRTTG